MDFIIDTEGAFKEQENQQITKSSTLVEKLLKEYYDGILNSLELPFDELKSNKIKERKDIDLDELFQDLKLKLEEIKRKLEKKETYTVEISNKKNKPKVNSKKEINIDKLFEDLGWNDEDSNNKKRNKKLKRKEENVIEKSNEKLSDEVKEVLKKSIITPEFEKLHAVPPADVSDKTLRIQRKKERAKTKGNKWFGLPATEMTPEIKRDLEIIKMRSVLDPKHFYKKNDMKVLPKYFQIGKVMDSPLDFYNGRLTKKERKRTLVDELLADAEFNRYNKRKYKEIIEEKQKTDYKAWKEGKKLKKKRK